MSAITLPCAGWGTYTLLMALGAPVHEGSTRARAMAFTLCLGGIGGLALWSGRPMLFASIEAGILLVQLLAAAVIILTAPPKGATTGAGIGLEQLLIGASTRWLVVGLVTCLALA
jgi:hypothetical protein